MNKIIKRIFSILVLFLLLLGNLDLTSALLIGHVTFDSIEIAPGDTIAVEVTIENNAEEEVTDISVVLDVANAPFAPVDSGTEFGIEEIRAKKNKIARFKLLVLENAKSEIYKIPVKITYKDESNETKTKNSLISIRITSEPVMDIIADENLLLNNQNNEVNIRMVNKGISDIKFLEIEAERAQNTKILSPSKIYIGDLESDDFDSITYKVYFDNTQSKINFPVIVKYQDTLNNEYTKSFSIPLTIYSREEAIALGLIEKSYIFEISLIITLIFLIFILYRSWRKAKRKKVKGYL